jgi:hypothetical protein
MLDVLWPSAVAEGRAAGINMTAVSPPGTGSKGIRVPYQKGMPFNVCLLFGLHITAVGQITPSREAEDEFAEVQAMSRGSSEVWYTFPRHYNSAWSAKGPNTLRLVMSDDKLVGALLIGEQSTADALRGLIEQEAVVTVLKPFLQADSDLLKGEILQLWESDTWRQSKQPSSISELSSP